MDDTLKFGRVDIIIFPNGGKEVIGRIPADSPIKESVYLDSIKKFVEEHKNLDSPTKYTMYYGYLDDELEVSWKDYAGEIEQVEEQE